MYIAKEISKSLHEIVPLLEKSGINYWLARGVLRHWILKNEIGEGHSDLDFHIWEEDESKLQAALGSSFKETEDKRRPYKCVFKNKTEGSIVEFMFLFPSEEYPSLVYHERDNGKFYFPKKCVEGYAEKEVDGVIVRVPKEIPQYMVGLYGPEWEAEKKGDKGHIFKDNPLGLLEHLSRF